MTDLVPVRRALLSVSDKTDLVPFAKALVSRGVDLISTGGTAQALHDAEIDVRSVDELTGFPEMMGGRVKTLHPKVHGALLALRDDDDHLASMREHGIEPIDLVCINLYPFERTVSSPDVQAAEAIEQIDIGGPSMLRSGAKNFRSVVVMTSPSQYDRVVNELDANDGCTTRRLRAEFAATAFGRTSEYDAAIAAYLGRRSGESFPEILRTGFVKIGDLRYGENPHQSAAFYKDPVSTGSTIVNARQLAGKPLSYNNVLDAAAALETVKALGKQVKGAGSAACLVKHTNPCGAAFADSAVEAVAAALAGDPLASYGGILAVGSNLDMETAELLCGEGVFLEVIVAREYDTDALARLKDRWKNLRVLAVGDKKPFRGRKLEYRSVPGGMLVQDRDARADDVGLWEHRAGPKPNDNDLRDAGLVVMMCRAMSSNAIAIGGRDGAALRLFGAGAGQMDRVASCTIAVGKAGQSSNGAIAASDAFFPFSDGPQLLIDAGVRCIVHPGGSKRDRETLDLCEQHGVTCLLTGVRHFRH